MPLLQPLPADFDAEVDKLSAFFGGTLGFTPNSILTMQRRPAVARAFIELNRAVMTNDGRVTAEQKRLIGLLASHAAGCRYCQAHTALAARRFGATDARLTELWAFRTSPQFTAAERAAFEFALAAAAQPGAVDAGVQAELRAHWDEGEIVEIAAVVALFGFLNRWNDSMGTPLEAPAAAAAAAPLVPFGWSAGKHAAQG